MLAASAAADTAAAPIMAGGKIVSLMIEQFLILTNKRTKSKVKLEISMLQLEG